MKKLIDPPHFPKPRGYTNGVLCAPGRTLHVAGQVAFDKDARIVSPDFATQFLATLDNVIDVVRAAGGGTEHIVKLLAFVTDLDKYRAAQRGHRRGLARSHGLVLPRDEPREGRRAARARRARRDRGHRRPSPRRSALRAKVRTVLAGVGSRIGRRVRSRGRCRVWGGCVGRRRVGCRIGRGVLLARFGLGGLAVGAPS